MFIEPATPLEYKTIELDPFYPQIDINHFVSATRTGNGTITEVRYEEALTNAFVIVSENIIDKRAAWDIEGHSSLSSVNSMVLGTETFLVHYWRTAVYSLAAATLLETHSDITPAQDGYSIDQTLHPQIGQLRRAANEAIRKINDGSRIDCELI